MKAKEAAELKYPHITNDGIGYASMRAYNGRMDVSREAFLAGVQWALNNGISLDEPPNRDAYYDNILRQYGDKE